MPNFNYLAILVCAIIYMAIGFLWYSPLLFAKPWSKLMGYEKLKKEDFAKMQKEAMPSYLGTFLLNLVTGFIMSYLLRQMVVTEALNGALIGLLIWVGFVATTTLANMFFVQQSFKLWAINYGYALVSMMVSGAILAAWV